jgi:hypothetical protein
MQRSLLSRANQESQEPQHQLRAAARRTLGPGRLQAAELNSIIRSGPLLRASTTNVVAVVDRPDRPDDVPRLWGRRAGAPTTCRTSRRAGGSVGRVLESEHAADDLS